MRQLILLFALCFVTIGAYSQDKPFSFGIKAGANLSNMDVEHSDTKAKVGYQFGFVGEINLPNSFFLQGNLLLTSKGFKTDRSGVCDINYDGYEDEATVKMSWNALYLKLPVMIGYKINVTDNLKINFSAGPHIAYGIGGKITTKVDARLKYQSGDEIVKDKDKTDTFSDTSLKRFDAGLTGIVAVECNRLVFNIGYDYGLANISQGSNSIHNRNAFVTLGYRLF